MLRRLFNVIAALSLLISLASAVLWVRTHWRTDTIARDGKFYFDVWSQAGHICFTAEYSYFRGYEREAGEDDATFEKRLTPGYDSNNIPRNILIFNTYPASSDYIDVDGHFGGFAFTHGWEEDGPFLTILDVGYQKHITVQVPYWFLVLLTGAWPISRILWSPVRRRRRRLQRGQCVNCGYSLRATPNCCPECGTISNSK